MMDACEKSWNLKNHQAPEHQKIYVWGWKEALEWVLSESGGDCDYHIIEQELEDE